MNLLFSGVFGNPGAAERSLLRAFKNAGHVVTPIDYRHNRNDLCRLFEAAPPCHGFLLQRGDYFPVAILQSISVPKLYWDTEIPAIGYARNPPTKALDHDDVIQHGSFDHYFFWGQEIVDHFVRCGWVEATKASVLGAAFDLDLHRKLSHVTAKDIDVLFIGSMSPRRQHFIDALSQAVKVVVVTSFAEEMVEYFNRAKIVLNIHTFDFEIVESRVLEALGCGAFLLTETLPPGSPFTDGVELAVFRDPQELVAKANYYLEEDAKRTAIAEAGYSMARRDHTYDIRASTIIETFQELEADQSKNALCISPAYKAYRRMETRARITARIRSLAGALRRQVKRQ